MHFVNQYKVEILICLLLIVVFFFTRLFNIMSLPIFTDEAIYIRWSQIAKQDAAWRFISLTDGKQPLFIWITLILMRFIEDPLLAGRTVSVFSGFATCVGLFFFGKELFKNCKVGLTASALYILYPMAIVYDRMALYESLVTTFVIWGMYLSVLLARKIRFDIALVLGMVAGAGVLTKTNAFFVTYLLPLSLLLFDFKQEKWRNKFITFAFFALIATILTYLFYTILRLSPFFHIIEQKNALFVYPLKDWIQHPFNFFRGNIRGLFDWALAYMTVPFVILIAATVFNRFYIREKLYLLGWFLIPFLALALFGNNLYPRYLFFMTTPLLLIAAHVFVSLYRMKHRFLYVAIIVCSLGFMVYTDFLVITDFAKAQIAKPDLGQYIQDWPAGGGVKEATAFFAQEGKDKKIAVFTQGTFGLMPYAFEIYLGENSNISIKGLWPIGDSMPEEILDVSKKKDTYVVFYQPCEFCPNVGEAPRDWPLKVMLQTQKANPGKFLTVYKVVK